MTSSVNFAQPDVTLRLDLGGVIRKVSLSNAVSKEGTGDWVGRPWADTVASNNNAHVRRMIDDARTAGVSSFQQVRQRFPSGLELAVEYNTVRLGGDAGLIAIGRNLEAVAELRSRLVAAQASMERDYWKLRDVETRYRLLFDASMQPVLLISADDLRITEANPAAIRALGIGSDCDLLPEIPASQRDAFKAMLGRVREHGKAPGIVVHLGPDRQPWLVRASLVAGEPAAVFVLQLSAAGASAIPVGAEADIHLDQMVARLPVGLAVVDREGALLRVNQAFLQLVGQATQKTVVGQPLGRWLSGKGADADALLNAVRRKRTVSQFMAVVRSDKGEEIAVEIAADGDPDTQPLQVCVLLHRVTSAGGTRAVAHDLPRASRLGKATLREVVQEAVSAVERKLIVETLERAKGNRTIAAQMLGLSRQGLYMKLERYSLDGPGDSK